MDINTPAAPLLEWNKHTITMTSVFGTSVLVVFFWVFIANCCGRGKAGKKKKAWYGRKVDLEMGKVPSVIEKEVEENEKVPSRESSVRGSAGGSSEKTGLGGSSPKKQPSIREVPSRQASHRDVPSRASSRRESPSLPSRGSSQRGQPSPPSRGLSRQSTRILFSSGSRREGSDKYEPGSAPISEVSDEEEEPRRPPKKDQPPEIQGRVLGTIHSKCAEACGKAWGPPVKGGRTFVEL